MDQDTQELANKEDCSDYIEKENEQELSKCFFSIFQNAVLGIHIIKEIQESLQTILSMTYGGGVVTRFMNDEEEEEPPLKKKKHCCGFETTKIKNKEIISDAFLTSKYYLLYIDMIKKFLLKSSMNKKTKQLLYSESFTKNLNETKENLNFGFT